ncbi:hypothetical protein EYF80_003689 [Liparis tanakae]|uniref:Uncharacterized protein n=1 Tax=Liparis tanakae TaxID=230148 RepID=A0A4Z2J637_9TELE|nr:hypothetical protein EYF80_003689 [Liparis tanakae]
MQRNPGKQKLTDGIFRGFWIGKSSHFHPVGQSPGDTSSRERAGEDGGRRRIIKSGIHSKQKLNCVSHQQLTDLIGPLLDHRDSVDLPEFISDMDQTCREGKHIKDRV